MKLDLATLQGIQGVVDQNQRLVQHLNTGQHHPAEIRQLVGEITGQSIDDSVEIRLPFYTDYGRGLKLGHGVFLNSGVMITDLGGIILEDNVLIGPGASLLSVNHPLDPAHRHEVLADPIRIQKNAWVGANATILAGVTVGENAVVAAGAVVTKDVPAATVVAGVPAKVIKKIESSF